MTVLGIRELNYREILEAIKWPTMAKRGIRGDLIPIFKLLKQYDNVDSE